MDVIALPGHLSWVLVQRYVHYRVGWHLKIEFVLARQPFSFILLFPWFLILLLWAFLTVFILNDSGWVMNGHRRENKVVFTHAQKQTPLPKVIFGNENFITFNENKCEISPYLLQNLSYFFFWTLALNEHSVQPFTIIFLHLDWRQISSIPNFPIEQEVASRNVGCERSFPSEMQDRLKSIGFALGSNLVFLQWLYLNVLVVDFKKIDVVGTEVIRAPLFDFLLNFFWLEGRRKD